MIQKLFDEETQQAKYYQSVKKESHEEGFAEGREEGRLETLKDNTKKLRQKGWCVGEIAEFIEIPVVDVEIWLGEE